MHKAIRLWGLGAILTAVYCTPAHTESTGGTGGTPTLNLTITENQRVIVQLNYQQAMVYGSTATATGHSTFSLDAFDSDSGIVEPDWGRAEIVLGCGYADIVVYQYQAGQMVAITTEQIAIAQCLDSEY